MAKPPVGVIGLGIMGSAMSANLMRAGYAVVGYDVLAARRRDHRRAGGRVALACHDVARDAGIIICSLPSADALRRTADELGGIARAPRIVIETSTLPVAVKEDASRRLAARDVTLLDCPVSGTGSQARARDIVVYASGDRRACRTVAPIFNAIARAHYYIGGFGAASKMKFVANLLVAVHNVAAAEAMVLAMKAGLDPAMAVKVIGDGSGSSRMFQVRAPMMVKGEYSRAQMKLDVWRKDMTIIADFARRTGCKTPLFTATAPIYAAATRADGSQDTAAVCTVLERMAGYRRRHRR